MKRTLLSMLVFSLFFASCKQTSTESEKIQAGCDCEKAKAILWIDKEKGKKLAEYASAVRTVKVYANVYSDGTFRIISFCKKQNTRVEEYIRKKAAVFVIYPELFEGGYIQPGKQYLQLRYVPEKIK